MLGLNSSHISHVSLQLASFSSKLSFQEKLYSKEHWMIDVLSLCSTKDKHAFCHYKIFRSPKLRASLLENNPFHMHHTSGSNCVTSWDWGSGSGRVEQKKPMQIYGCLQVIKSFVSDPGVICLLLVTIKP